MNFELKPLSLAAAVNEKADLLLVLVSDPVKPGKDALSSVLTHALKAEDFVPKAGRVLSTYRLPAVQTARVVFVGVGDASAKSVRQGVLAGWSAVRTDAVKRVLLVPADGQLSDAALRAAVLALADASYTYTLTKSQAEPRVLQKVTFGVPEVLPAQRAALALAVATAHGIEEAKEWGNRPANHATPTQLAAAAKALATRGSGLQCEVLLPRDVAKLGMGSFMAVARGSEEELRFIVLRYQGAARTEAPVVLVGKGITFDTGGISIKPAAEMDEMKFDMCGAASVLGTFRALSELKPAINVVGLIPTCENMPDGRALKPGDVVTSMSGQTIEVLNTDAEGRLILCDALTYAERFKPRAVVDIATLTGACVVALGGVRSGLFSTDDALATALQTAGEQAQDLAWRLPLDDDYADGLKSNFADVANVGGRAGGAITAAKFLQRFATRFPWAHLDIAGTAWKSGGAKGATGRPVGLLLSYLLAQAQAQAAEAPAAAAKPRRKAAAPKKA
ncbi:leucyl aminopeptidase [Curvibacter sp. HBC61]|uniref:Probable cytosol aminopeptidase n=1 Tax=Curvibacter cyanobacteriorum TaxID=3026422 RepID=A0ABT5N5M0_9BURK|nr:leucyl aminopeptidase [Curvibacter sp. HBC61]MDD0840956.1 leucyl aminopeptidase [Curvibacter sp. HBC61]